MGTAQYMSPEQARGQTADARSDIWSLGVVLYEMVAGNPPFSGATPSECIASILKTEPPPVSCALPGVPAKLQSIVHKALRKNRDERYQTINEMLADLRDLKEKPELEVASRAEPIFSKIKRHKRGALLGLVAALLTAIALSYRFYVTVRGPSLDEKSIAVLPFENRSEDTSNAYFADGVQDEILTRLSKIRDLKVISRTSTQHYKNSHLTLAEIAKQLGVANVLEGSVQKTNDQVRVNVQLIKATNDLHLWAETYDRDLADVFAIQSEIAKTVADQLQTKLSPNEKIAIERPPTSDITAFDLYARAKSIFLTGTYRPSGRANLLQAADLLNQAVARDPSFLQAYCQLALVHDLLYSYNFDGHDRTPARLALAEAAIQAAARLRPDAAEVHLARAENLYSGYLDYDGALVELELARRTLANDSRVFELIGYIQRRQGRWEESTRNLKYAVELDPRNVDVLQEITFSYQLLRRYRDEEAIVDRILALQPDDVETKVERALIELEWHADTRPLRQTLDSIRTTNPGAVPVIAEAWLTCALAERDAGAAKNALIAAGQNPINLIGDANSDRPLIEAVVARMTKDDDKARSTLNVARAKQEKIVENQPNFGPSWCALGLIDAALGRKEEALREGRRAVELVPIDKDAIRGPAMVKSFAMIAAWVGDIDLACNKLQTAVSHPSVLSHGELKLLPFWDPLRGDPRFERLVEDAKQPVTPEPAAESTPDKSLAVLPFENRSEDGSNAYFADGVQDEILTRLSKIGDLKVISRTSTQRYKNSPLSLAEIAKQLGVANLLEGSVQKTNDQVRVNVQLIKAANDSHLWAETYDRQLTDIFAVESEVAAAIADTLHAKLTGFEQRAIATRPTQNAEAHQLYLKGTFFSNKRTGSDLRTAIGYFRGAIDKDANYALAYAGLADAYALLALYGGEAPKETVPQAKAAAHKALELDETSPEAHNSLGLLLALYDFDFTQSKSEFERAIELNPNYATAHHQFGNVNLSMIGEFDRAIAEGKRAVELDPLSLIINTDLGQDFMLARRYDEAIEQLRKTLAMDPRFYYARWTLGECLQMQGKLTEAIAEYRKAAEITDDPMVMALLAQGYAKTGERDKALALLSQLEQLATQRYIGPFTFALVHLALGKNEKAIDDLERAYRERGDPGIVGIKVEPLLDPLRGHPRFERLVAEVLGTAENKSLGGK